MSATHPDQTSSVPQGQKAPEPAGHRGPVMITSWNGTPALNEAAARLARAEDPLRSLVAGIQLVEDDPTELSVGLGGLPNEDGQVELDAAVMDGPQHRAGAVAGVRHIRHVARLAHEVLRRTDHALLVGEGALKFADALGFPRENLLTDVSRKAWLDWKANLSPRDGWLAENELASDFGRAVWAGHTDPAINRAVPSEPRSPMSPGTPSTAPFTFGTIHASLLTAPGGDLYSCTSTSGLSYKIAGRVGDTPIVGGGLYTDNAVGSAGATGRGEAVMQSCGAFAIVSHMAAGLTPTEACLRVLKSIADKTKAPRLLDPKGRPTFNITLYALRKDGVLGSASMHEGYEYVVHQGGVTSTQRAAFLFPKE